MSSSEPLSFFGNPSSPYTRKMLSLLRYRRIAHSVIWGSPDAAPKHLPKPKVGLLPTFYFRMDDGSFEAVVDSTPIARRLEEEYKGRSAIPEDAELAFYMALIEDYADEWLTKPMFHYRWHHDADRQHAGRFLSFTSDTSQDRESAENRAEAFTKRQFERLYVVGSNDQTAEIIETSYERFLGILDSMLEERPYLLGNRPSVADFAVFGQMTQLGLVDPTPRRLMLEKAPRLEAWLWKTDDLSGLELAGCDWSETGGIRRALAPLLDEIAQTYQPVLLANAKAVMNGATQFTADVHGSEWTQPTFPYQAKCLAELRDRFASLDKPAKKACAATMTANNCGAMIEGLT
ncbi:glutathione S-transferase family protein [Qipengyuania sp. DSG2-2]|uniref:glutathione S-transferase family protein n=1 Tax=Qipengyuania sp. DGS2-2 TaxID=3349631 RepID=UPI0036D319BA